MPDDCIVVALGLPQLKILWQKELEGHIEVVVIYRWGEARCPRCGKVTHKERDRRRSSYRFRGYLRQKALHQTVRRTAQKRGGTVSLIYWTNASPRLLSKQEV